MAHLLKPEAQAVYKSLEGALPRHKNTPDGLRASIGDRSLYGPLPSKGLKPAYEKTTSGPLGEVPLTIYEPTGAGPFPIILYFHGGGFVIGNNVTHRAIPAHLAVNCRAVVVAVDYRLAPENSFPAAVTDSWAATQWAAINAESINGDASRMAAAGESAGGNLSAVMTLLGVEEGLQLLKAQVMVCPCMDATCSSASFTEFEHDAFESKKDIQWFYDLYLQGQTGAQPHFNPSLAPSHSGLPPALVLTAEVDVLRDEGEKYAELLRAHGVAVNSRRCLGHYHNSMLNVGLFGEHALDTYREIAAFLSNVFGEE